MQESNGAKVVFDLLIDGLVRISQSRLTRSQINRILIVFSHIFSFLYHIVRSNSARRNNGTANDLLSLGISTVEVAVHATTCVFEHLHLAVCFEEQEPRARIALEELDCSQKLSGRSGGELRVEVKGIAVKSIGANFVRLGHAFARSVEGPRR